MGLLMVIPAILPALLMHALKGGDDDDLAKRMAKWQLGYLMNLMLLVREGSGLVEGFDYQGPPVGRILVETGKAIKQTAQGEIDEQLILAYRNAIGVALGIPTAQLGRSYKGWKAWSEGQEGASILSVLFGPPPKK